MSNTNKVLIVDDDKLNLNVCRSVLEEYYTIEVAINGEDAIHKAEAFMPDIILMDWEMPVLNGLDALKIIKSNPSTKNIQVIFMTRIMADQNNMLEAFQNGTTDFIRKPFDTLELKARINSVMQSVNYFRSEIDSRNKELIKLTLLLSENDVVIESVIKQINEVQKALPPNEVFAQSKIIEIKNNLSSRIVETKWKLFEKHFKAIHPNFYKNLSARHPSLTQTELKLASLLSLNMDTKEIAAIFHQTVGSTKVSRARLRRNLQIESNINLNSYLMQF